MEVGAEARGNVIRTLGVALIYPVIRNQAALQGAYCWTVLPLWTYPIRLIQRSRLQCHPAICVRQS